MHPAVCLAVLGLPTCCFCISLPLGQGDPEPPAGHGWGGKRGLQAESQTRPWNPRPASLPVPE